MVVCDKEWGQMLRLWLQQQAVSMSRGTGDGGGGWRTFWMQDTELVVHKMWILKQFLSTA